MKKEAAGWKRGNMLLPQYKQQKIQTVSAKKPLNKNFLFTFLWNSRSETKIPINLCLHWHIVGLLVFLLSLCHVLIPMFTSFKIKNMTTHL